MDHVAGFVSCVTAMAPTKAEMRRKRKRQDDVTDEEVATRQVPGISFWVMVTCPENDLSIMEGRICNLLLQSGLALNRCDVLKPEVKIVLLY